MKRKTAPVSLPPSMLRPYESPAPTFAEEKDGEIVISGPKAAWLLSVSEWHDEHISDTLERLAAGAYWATGRECAPQAVTIQIKAGTPLARIVSVNLALAPELNAQELLQGWIEHEAETHSEDAENLAIPAKSALAQSRNRRVTEHALGRKNADKAKPKKGRNGSTRIAFPPKVDAFLRKLAKKKGLSVVEMFRRAFPMSTARKGRKGNK